MSGGESPFGLYDDLLSPVAALEGGVFVYFNQSFAQFLQLPPRKIRGRPLGEVLGNPTLDPFLAGGVTPELVVGAGEARKEVVLKFFAAANGAVVLTIQDFSLERVLHAKHRVQLDEIKKYSEGLEVLVEQRTQELRSEKEQLGGILRSIREGLLVVERDLKLGPEASAAAFAMLGRKTLAGVPALDALFPSVKTALAAEAKKKLGDFLASAFNLFVPDQFEDLARFAPKSLRFSVGDAAPRLFSLSYSAVVENDEVRRVVVALRDDTELEELRQHAVLVHRRVVDALARLTAARTKDGELIRFVREARELMTRIEPGVASFGSVDVNLLFRLLHTLKGGARQHKLAFLEHFAHQAEDVLDLYRGGRPVDRERHLAFEADVGALATGVAALSEWFGSRPDEASGADSFEAYVASLKSSTEALALELGKVVRFEARILARPEGQDLGLLTRMLGHLVRNALDHGIEDPATRLLKGKPAAGTLRLTVEALGTTLVGRLEDDGKGIDLASLARKAKVRDLTLGQALDIIAAPGFSTKGKVTEISGRGVGLDVALSELKARGGSLAIERTDGSGTTFRFAFQANDSADVKAS